MSGIQGYKQLDLLALQVEVVEFFHMAATAGPSGMGKCEVVADKIIECVALFYERGMTKLQYSRKEKFHCKVPGNISRVKQLKSYVR